MQAAADQPELNHENRILKRFWFGAKRGPGIGVTAYDRDDAQALVRENGTATIEPIFDRRDFLDDDRNEVSSHRAAT